MVQPSVYFISRNLTPEQIQSIREMLLCTPLAAVIVCDPRDAEVAANFSDVTSFLPRPIAIVADFPDPLTAVNPDGSLCPLLKPSKQS